MSSVACNRIGTETNWGGILRTDILTYAEAWFPFSSDIAYVKESFPLNPLYGV